MNKKIIYNENYREIEPFIQKVQANDSIVIAGHTSPDGDAVSATLALAMALRKMGKEVVVLLEEYLDNYKYVKGVDMIYKGDYLELRPDIFVSIDCGEIERLGEAKKVYEKSKIKVNIDHHESNNNFADINIVNKKASSTSEIIFEIVNHIGAIDFNIATAIYTGIVFDTCGFKHKSTSKRTHEIAGELIEVGVDSSMVHTNLLYTHSIENARILSKAIQNIEFVKDIAISTLTNYEIKEECMADCTDIEGISNYMLDIKGIDISVFLYEKDDESIKVSFRSNEKDVNKIASMFGGGGHILAAATTIKNMTLQEAKKAILEKITT